MTSEEFMQLHCHYHRSGMEDCWVDWGEEMEGSCNRGEHRRRFEERKGNQLGMDRALEEESHGRT